MTTTHRLSTILALPASLEEISLLGEGDLLLVWEKEIFFQEKEQRIAGS
jgi:hypothetical protein